MESDPLTTSTNHSRKVITEDTSLRRAGAKHSFAYHWETTPYRQVPSIKFRVLGSAWERSKSGAGTHTRGGWGNSCWAANAALLQVATTDYQQDHMHTISLRTTNTASDTRHQDLPAANWKLTDWATASRSADGRTARPKGGQIDARTPSEATEGPAARVAAAEQRYGASRPRSNFTESRLYGRESVDVTSRRRSRYHRRRRNRCASSGGRLTS